MNSEPHLPSYVGSVEAVTLKLKVGWTRAETMLNVHLMLF